MTTTTTKSLSVKEQCFAILAAHPDRCFLYIYGEEIELFTEHVEILSRLLNARFGSSFCLAYRDVCNIRHSINVLVDDRNWLCISECMSSLLYNYTKRKS